MTTTVEAPVRAPYKGLSPFEDSDVDALLFFGRERETDIVVANALAARLTLLYGPSGVGKSSLLRAGAVHALRRLSATEPLAVVYYSSWAGDPCQGIEEGVRGALAETYGGDPGDAPGDLADRIDGWTAALGAQLVLVLDQFEEHFLYHEAGGVHELLPELATRPGVRVNVVLGIRDDELARLDVFKPRIPGLFANSLRLDRLTRDAARSAILGPLERYNELSDIPVSIEPKLVEAVLAEVEAGRFESAFAGRGGASLDPSRIEAPYLQLVLQRVWDVERERHSQVLRAATLAELGGARRIVEDHLERAMAALSPAEQHVAAGMFDHLVTPSGTKIAHAVSDLASFARVDERQLRPVLSSLARERIVRATGDEAAAGNRYEIYHDVLAGAVLTWKAEHEAAVALEHERESSRRRQRRLATIAGVALAAFAVMAALAIYAFSQRSTARNQAAIARVQQANAERAEHVAQEATTRADRLRAAAQQQSARYRNLSGRYQRTAATERALAKRSRAQAVTLSRQYSDLADKNGRLNAATATLAKQKAVLARQAGELGRTNRELRAQATALRTAKTRADERSRHAVAEELLQRAQAEVVNDPLQGVRDALAAATRERVARVEDVLRSSLLATHVLAALPSAGPATAAEYSPNSAQIAVGSAKGTIRVYAVPTGRLRRTLHAGGPVTTLGWSTDGKLLAGASKDGSVRLWDVATGRLARTLEHGAAVRSVAFSPGRDVLETSGGHDTKLWDSDGHLLQTLSHGERLVRSAAFSNDGALIVTTADQNVARVWDVATGRLLQALQQRSTINAAAFGPGGSLVATASQDGSGRIWNARTGAVTENLLGHTAAVRTIAFSPTGDRVATGSVDGTLRVWSTTTGLVDVVRGFTSPVVSVAFSPDGQSEIGLEGNGRAITAGVAQPQQSLVGQRGSASMAAYAPDGATVATVAGSSVWLWEPYGEPRLHGVHVHEAPATALAFDPTGRFLASADANGTVVVQKAHGGVVRSFSAGGTVVSLSWAVDGDLLVATKDGSIQVHTHGNANAARVLRHGATIVAAALRDDGATAATAGTDGLVRLWSARTGRLLLTIHVGRPATAVALDTPGRFVAVGAGDDVFVYAAATGRQVATLTGHTDTVTGVAFSHDGTEIASASRDHDARTWTTRRFRALHVLHRHASFLSGVAFSKDGRWLATAGALKAGVWSSTTSDLPGDFLLFARGNAVPITAVAWSPRGWELATASRDGSIRVVDCTLCGHLEQLERHARSLVARLPA